MTDAAVLAAKAQPSLRPWIYVYDLPAIFNTRMLQYRNEKVEPSSDPGPPAVCSGPQQQGL